MKTNVVFGGIKIFQMIVALLKNKIVAVLLGPSGVGIQSLLVSTVNTIHQFSSLGINQSAVREISIEKDLDKKNAVVRVTNQMAVILGVFSSIICLAFSKQLSYFVFESYDFTIMIKILSLSLFFESISNAQIAILQGIRAVKSLALGSLIGSVLALGLSVPIYYLYRIEAIPYALAIGYSASALVLLLFKKKELRVNVNITKPQFKSISERILSLGIALMLSNCIMTFLSLGLNVFINRYGSSTEVGYYQAAYACTYSVVSILVAILASDYYPRLSSLIDDKEARDNLINSQIKILELCLAPVVVLMCCFPELIISILYTGEFLCIATAVQLMGIALFFRIIWHSFSYVILAVGDKKSFLIVDAIIGNGVFFVGSMIGFYLGGINGIAYSYIVTSLIVMIILFVLVHYKYGVQVDKVLVYSLIAFVTICIISILLKNQLPEGFIKIILLLCIVLIVAFFCMMKLNKMTGVIESIIVRVKKIKK